MDQYSMSRAKPFVLKTNIHCKGCEKKIKKLLKDVGGVDKISIDAAQGKIQILGSIDPHKVLKLLDKHGKKSELLWEPVMESHVVPTPQSSRSGTSHYDHHIDHDNKDLVVHLKKMSEIKGLRCVEVSEEGMKLTFREYDQKGEVYDGQNDSNFFARNSNGTAMHMTYHGDQHANSNNPADDCPSCSRNKAIHTHGSFNGSPDNAPVEGIPWRPGYIKPSAPPLVQMPPQYYSPAPPSYEYMQQASYNYHPVFSAFSDENPNSCIIM